MRTTLDSFAAYSAYDVILLNGQPQPSDEIHFDSTTYHFTNDDGADITNLITRADKLDLVPGFDIDKDNIRLSRERPINPTGLVGPTPALDTSIFVPAITGIAQDIRTGGGAAVAGIGQGVKDTVQTVVIFGIAGIVAYFLLGGKLKL